MTRTIYFTSDLHLGHKNIFKFGQRSHETLEHMHVAIMDAWNRKVKKQRDIVYVLGDVAMDITALKWLNYMNGSKRLVLGNHDKFDYPVYTKYFDKVYHFHKAYHGMVLTHIPIHPCELKNRNWLWNVHGHIHDPLKDIKDDRYFNVNMDIIGYAPISLEELREKLSKEIVNASSNTK